MANPLPSNLEAERFVLVALLHRSLAFDRASAMLIPDDFSITPNRVIFARMKDIFTRGEVIDRVTVANELMKQEQLESIGGLSYLVSLEEGMPELANVDSYIHIIKEKFALRSLARYGEKIMSTVAQEVMLASEILDEASRGLEAVAGRLPIADEVPSLELIVDEITPSEILKPSARNSIKTGLARFDYMTTGFEPGTLTVVAGRPSSGKTMLGLTTALNIAQASTPLAFFSMEMGKRDLIDRMICAKARVDLMTFRHGLTSDEEMVRLKMALAGVYELPIYIDDKPAQSVSDVARKIDRLRRERHIRVVYIDYLQLMVGGYQNSKKNSNEILTEIVEGLKSVAKRMDVAMCCLAQLNRGPEGRQDHRPTMGELRGSGSMEQAADTIALLYREFQYKPERDDLKDYLEVIVAKQRQGGTGSFGLKFEGKYCTVGDMDG